MDGPGAIAADGTQIPEMTFAGFLGRPPYSEEAEKDIGTIAALNEEGDIKFSWDRNNPKECEAAHEHFEVMQKKGFLIFKVKSFGRKSKKPAERFDPKEGKYAYVAPSTEKAEIVQKFDPKEDYVATPRVAGG